MSASPFLFSFVLFFQVNLDKIRDSGFYKLIEEKYPAISQSLNTMETDEGFLKIQKLTGLKPEDVEAIDFRVEALDGIEKVGTPTLGTHVDFFTSMQIKGSIKSDELIGYLLDQLEEKSGADVREKAEDSKIRKGTQTTILIPADSLKDAFPHQSDEKHADLMLGLMEGEKVSNVFIGVKNNVLDAMSGNELSPVLEVSEAMAEDRQISFAMKIDPALWDRPEFSPNPQAPLLAGLSNSMKGIREVGFSFSFRGESLGVEICVHCQDSQSALGLWTVAQGGLGMAQLSMAQQAGAQFSSIVSRIKTEAKGKEVFVRVEVLPSDLDEFAAQIESAAKQANTTPANIPHSPQSLVTKPSPPFEIRLLDDKTVSLPALQGKVVVLDFWASWCGPCVKGLPIVDQVVKKLGGEEVVLFAINQGESKEQINTFLRAKKLEHLTVGFDPENALGKLFHVQGIPQTVVIDQSGKVHSVHVGFSANVAEKLSKEIQELLSQ